MYKPTDEVPSEETFDKTSHTLIDEGADGTTTIKNYFDATVGVHDGDYTCVVYHGPEHEPAYSVDRCQVIIVDLCADSGCGDKEICEPDYSTGTVECTCKYDCEGMDMDVVCTTSCDIFWHECAMNEETCKDGIEREIMNKGFCPTIVNPKIREIDQEEEIAVEELGTVRTLHSGLMEDGTPSVHIQWVFHPESGEPVELSAREIYTLTLDENSAGTYKITIMQCMNQSEAFHNEYRLGIFQPPSTPPTSTPTAPPDDIKVRGHTCSAFPGGVIEDFNSRPHFYDLSCTHVLAADFMPGGNYVSPWFIYGTFDNHDGKTALMSMTFYLGREIFEVQRGWLVHAGNGKFAFKEGVSQEVGETGCSLTFQHGHMNVDCPHFQAHYDGVMSGHIKLKGVAGDGNLQKGRGNVGLCFDSRSGWRPNWQVGNMKGDCLVDKTEPACETEAPDNCMLSQPPAIDDSEWTACGMGAESACSELHCDGSTPTPAQKCALERANRVNCSLKMGASVAGVDVACPEEPCDWYKDVASRGCPQENLPFVCL